MSDEFVYNYTTLGQLLLLVELYKKKYSGSAKYTGWEKFAISTEIAVYLGNGAR